MSYVTEHGIRWTPKAANLVPGGLLQRAAPARTLDQVTTSWRNAHRVESDHGLEVAQLVREAVEAVT